MSLFFVQNYDTLIYTFIHISIGMYIYITKYTNLLKWTLHTYPLSLLENLSIIRFDSGEVKLNVKKECGPESSRSPVSRAVRETATILICLCAVVLFSESARTICDSLLIKRGRPCNHQNVDYSPHSQVSWEGSVRIHVCM